MLVLLNDVRRSSQPIRTVVPDGDRRSKSMSPGCRCWGLISVSVSDCSNPVPAGTVTVTGLGLDGPKSPTVKPPLV